MAQIQVRDEHGVGVFHANIRIALGHQSSDEAKFDILTDPAGNQSWPILYWPVNQDYTFHVNKRDVLLGYGEAEVYVPIGTVTDIPVTLPTKPIEILPLHVDGLDFRDSNNQRYVINEVTNFMLFQRFLHGEDITSLLYPEFNMDRVFFTMLIIPGQVDFPVLTPENYGDFWPKVESFFQFETAHGRRVDANLLQDMQMMAKSVGWMRNFVGQFTEIAAKYNPLISLGNEVEKNGVDPSQFTKPAGVMSCSGSSLSDGPCPSPFWDYLDAHLTRSGVAPMLANANQAYMVYGYTGFPPTMKAIITSETIGADEQPSSSRSNDPALFRQLGRAMRARCGGCFHHQAGIHSQPMGPVQDQCRAAFLE